MSTTASQNNDETPKPTELPTHDEVTGHEAKLIAKACGVCGTVYMIPEDYTFFTCPRCGTHLTP